MKVLGISGRPGQAAAAISVDGVLVAAATENATASTAAPAGWPAAAMSACLSRAGLIAADLDRVSMVSDVDDPPVPADMPAPVSRLDGVDADALHAAMSSGATWVLVGTTQPPALRLSQVRDGAVHTIARIDGMAELVAAAAATAVALGVGGSDPFQRLDRLSLGGDPDYQSRLAAALAWHHEPPRLVVDAAALAAFVTATAAAHGGSLANRASHNVALQRARQAMAASVIAQLASVLAAAIQSLGIPANERLALGGDLFANVRLCGECRARSGRALVVAAVPELIGRALGAAVHGVPLNGHGWAGLGLGPVFSEADIKHTLDNCRLDYVYEPDWSRLHTRVSKMLAHGKVVAWFQGALTFGPRSFGSRSILCDPSGRYARHNMNEYLRQQPLDEPLPLVFAASAAAAHPAVQARAFEVRDAAVPPGWHGALSAALDWRQHVRVHGLDPAQSPELAQLLETHFQRTGTPALIETPLVGGGDGMACTPRDAVRTAYSSAVDALVVGRLLLMKDHWLLRTETA